MIRGEVPARFPTAILMVFLLLFVVAMIHGVANDWPAWGRFLSAMGAGSMGVLVGERIDN